MHDVLFSIPLPFGGAVTIHSYGLMAMLGFVAGVLIARWRADSARIPRDTVVDAALWALLGGIVGSRIVYVFQNSGDYFDTSRPEWSPFDALKIWQGGLVFYGGLAGALIVVVVFLRVRGQRMLPLLDALMPSLAIGHAFGRVGCFLHGCCYGVPVAAGRWYGIMYPKDSLPYATDGPNHIAAWSPLFPTQLVESAGLLAIFAVVSLYFKRRRGDGAVTGLYLMLYAILRFTVEFWRADTHEPGVLSPAQWISIFAFFGGMLLMAFAHFPRGTDLKVAERRRAA